MRFPVSATLALISVATACAAIKEVPKPVAPSVEAPVALAQAQVVVPDAPPPLPSSPELAASLADSQPSILLRIAPTHRYVLVVDLPHARLYVLENTAQGFRIVRQHYAAMGKNGFGKQIKGDNRTPLGVYTATGFTPSTQLPDFYGAGAFPLTYPNDWDYHRKRTGSGIWLHGVPANTYTRAPRSSEGCVTMSNDNLAALRPYLQGGETPVVLTDKLDWVSSAKVAAMEAEMRQQIEGWRSNWSAINTEAYLDYYAPDFTTAGLNKAAFSDYKRRVNGAKKRISVGVRDLDLYAYPGEKDLVLAQFTQDYDSDNFKVVNRKQQYWKKQADGKWKILLEESR